MLYGNVFEEAQVRYNSFSLKWIYKVKNWLEREDHRLREEKKYKKEKIIEMRYKQVTQKYRKAVPSC